MNMHKNENITLSDLNWLWGQGYLSDEGKDAYIEELLSNQKQ